MTGNNKKNEAESRTILCPRCGRKAEAEKNYYCRACGRELYTPVIESKSSFRILIAIVLIAALLYVFYLLVKEPLYYWLDKIPHKPY